MAFFNQLVPWVLSRHHQQFKVILMYLGKLLLESSKGGMDVLNLTLWYIRPNDQINGVAIYWPVRSSGFIGIQEYVWGMIFSV